MLKKTLRNRDWLLASMALKIYWNRCFCCSNSQMHYNLYYTFSILLLIILDTSFKLTLSNGFFWQYMLIILYLTSEENSHFDNEPSISLVPESVFCAISIWKTNVWHLAETKNTPLCFLSFQLFSDLTATRKGKDTNQTFSLVKVLIENKCARFEHSFSRLAVKLEGAFRLASNVDMSLCPVILKSDRVLLSVLSTDSLLM